MRKIILCKPVVIGRAIRNMTTLQYFAAYDLLHFRAILIPEQRGLRMIWGDSKTMPDYFLYGSEAVCFYRQSMGLSDVSIREIPVGEILENETDMVEIKSITESINKIEDCNKQLLHDLVHGCPFEVLKESYRALESSVSGLDFITGFYSRKGIKL